MKKKTMWNIAKVLIAVALLSYFLFSNDLGLIWQNLKKINFSVWIVVAVMTLLSVGVNALKWKTLIPEFHYKDLTTVCFIFGFYTLVLPGQLISEGVKILILGKKYASLERVGASVLVDKITGLVALMLMGTIGVILSSRKPGNYFIIIFLGGSISMLTALYLINFIPFKRFLERIFQFLSRKIKRLAGLVAVCEKLVAAWSEFSGNWPRILVNICFGILYQLLTVLPCVLFSRAVGVDVGIIDWMWIEPVLSVALLLPITIGGFGVREGTLVGMLGLLGVMPEQALVISFALVGQQLIRAIPGGLMELHRNIKAAREP